MERDEQLWVIFQFIFYCFFRPGREVRLMKVGDIDFNAGLLWSRTDTAKNDKEKAVVIPDHFLEYLKKKGYHRADKNHYMFTIDGKPGKTSLGKNYIYKHFKKARAALGLNTYIYAAKHTGNRKLSDNGADLLDIMRQNRHSTPNQTYVYLKSLEDDYSLNLKEKFFVV
jgi:integrase